jgi:hypothetical protein
MATDLWSVLAVASTVAAGGLFLELRDARRARDAERARGDAATDRLLAAWREGYTIPEPDADPVEEEPLPAALQEWLSQWEGADAQAKWEAELRRKLAQGRTVDQILMDVEVS